MGLKEAAEQFGMSATMLRRIECRALYKLWKAAQECNFLDEVKLERSESPFFAIPKPRHGLD
jgi:hypothetical protein